MNKMAEEADLLKNKCYIKIQVYVKHIPKITYNNVSDMLQVYVVNYKNVGSLSNYHFLSDNHKLAISNILSRHMHNYWDNCTRYVYVTYPRVCTLNMQPLQLCHF